MAQPTEVVVFTAGEDDYHTYRIPSLFVTPGGGVLAICEGRKHSRSDTGAIDLVLKRSEDGGRTFGPLQAIAYDPPHTMGNPCPVADRDTSAIWMPLTRNLGHDAESAIIDGTSEGTREVWICHSLDDGYTWSWPVQITQSTKKPNWTWYATGPGVGIQLHTGRLVIPCDFVEARSKLHGSHVIYSDDHGESWLLGGVVGSEVNECQVVERRDGSLLMNMRNHTGTEGPHSRAIATSHDGGMTWSGIEMDPALPEPVCQASLVRYATGDDAGTGPLLFSNPAGPRRERMTVRVSFDEGATWERSALLWEGPAAYSCLATLPDGRVGCLHERGVKNPYETIALAAFDLEWVTEGQDRR
jgi:sialidase-1